jgi:hypothetical protein
MLNTAQLLRPVMPGAVLGYLVLSAGLAVCLTDLKSLHLLHQLTLEGCIHLAGVHNITTA